MYGDSLGTVPHGSVDWGGGVCDGWRRGGVCDGGGEEEFVTEGGGEEECGVGSRQSLTSSGICQ